MSLLVLLLAALVAAMICYWWWRRQFHAGEIKIVDATTGLRPTKVVLPDEDGEQEERPESRRPPETQALQRRVVRGPYRAIDDRGPPSEVQTWRQT